MYFLRVIESQSTYPKIFPCDAESLRGARKEARGFLGGCHIGSGRVEIYDKDPRKVESDPIVTLKA